MKYEKIVTEVDLEEFLVNCSSRVEKSVAKNTTEIGLFNGLSGDVLSLSYLSKFTNIISVDRIIPLVGRVVECLKQPTSGTLCSGTTGACWMLRLIAQEGIIDTDDINSVIEDIDRLNVAVFKCGIANGNMDYLHGALGIAHYLLQYGIDIELVSTSVVDKLREMAEEDSFGRIRWRTTTYVQKYRAEDVYNLGVAHGMAAIIYVLSEIIEITQNDEARTLLSGILLYYTDLYEKHTSFPFSFPLWMPIPGVNSSEIQLRGKKAWCYGDFGVSYALLKAARVLNDDSLLELAINTLEKTLNDEKPVPEWCFCHGSAGLYYMYKKIYTFSHRPEFEASSKLWLSRLYNMRRDILSDDLLGILQGVPGVILALLNDDKYPLGSWDSFLLLDAI